MARGNTWSVPAGESLGFAVTISNDAGAITGTYSDADALAAAVWEGGDLAPIAGVCSCAWISATDGTVLATVAPPSSMSPGYYRVRLSVAHAGQTSPFYAGWIRVEAIPGTASESPTYGSMQDLLDYAGDWLEQLMQEGSGDQANFARERAKAREWLDDCIVGSSRVSSFNFDPTYALYYGSFPFGPVEAPDRIIAGYLASDYLMVKPRTIECVSYKALAFICEKRQTFDERGEEYVRRARYYHRMASNSLRRYRAELDTNGDGIPDIAFNLGVITFR